MPTQREHLIALGLAKPGRGRLSLAAHAEIKRAIAQGVVFDLPPPVKQGARVRAYINRNPRTRVRVDECIACGELFVSRRFPAPLHPCCERATCAQEAERRRRRTQPSQKHAPRCAVVYGDCHYCGALFARRKGAVMKYPRCTREACEKAQINERMREHSARKRAEGIDIFAKYRDREKDAAARRARAAEYGRPPSKQAADARRRVRLRGGVVENFTHREIFERDGWTCGICDDAVDAALKYPDPMSASLDHILPVSHGGDHTRVNVRCTHLSCNVRRGNRIAA